MRVLIYAEHSNERLSLETAKLVSGAKQICDQIDVLVAGFDCDSAVQSAAQLDGVTKILQADHLCYAHQLAEPVSKLLVSLAKDYTHIIGAGSTTGKNIMPRLAALLDVEQVSDVTQIEQPDVFIRPIYAGNAIAKVKSEDATKVLTLRTSAFDLAQLGGNATIETVSFVAANDQSHFVSEQLSQSTRPELTSAPVVISGGRGMKSADNFVLLEAIADKLGGAIGASRAAVDAGFVSNDLQVGQTGKIVAPDLYIAVGISGAIQHLAGMKDAKIVVAINQDAEAPIFEVADYGLVGDLFDILPELEKALG